MNALTDSQIALATETDSTRLDEHHNSATDSAIPPPIRVAQPMFDWNDQLPTLRDAREAFDRAYLVELLRRVGGNVSAAARLSGRNRTDLYDLLRRCHVDPTDFRSLSRFAGSRTRRSDGAFQAALTFAREPDERGTQNRREG